jgi:catechol 2,3-dioxygenase-like lactoylglutathione lyase family enzyme
MTSLDHFNIETVELGATVAFYRDLLGMTLGDRPDVGIPGAWMCIGHRAVIHINEVDESQVAKTGAIDHVAFEAEDFDRMVERLQQAGQAHDMVDSRPKLPLRQLYVLDPNRIRIELNFRRE